MLSLPVTAEEEEEEAAPEAPETFYYQVEPDVVTNYMRNGSKLGFIVVQVNIETSGDENLELLQDNYPLIVDVLIELISNMTREQVTDLDARELVREQIKERLKKELIDETGKELVNDLFFTKYTYQ